MKIECSHCSQRISIDPSEQELEGACPTCGELVMIPASGRRFKINDSVKRCFIFFMVVIGLFAGGYLVMDYIPAQSEAKAARISTTQFADIQRNFNADAPFINEEQEPKWQTTLDLQRRLKAEYGNIVFRGELIDVYQSRKEGLMAQVEVSQGGATSDIYLKCDDAQVEPLLQRFHSQSEPDFIFVAKMEDVDSEITSGTTSKNSADYKDSFYGSGTMIFAEPKK